MDPFSDHNAVVGPVSPQASEADPFSDQNVVIGPVSPQDSEVDPFSDQNAANDPISPLELTMDPFSDYNTASNPDSPQEANITHPRSHDKTTHPPSDETWSLALPSNTNPLTDASQSLLTISWFHRIPVSYLLERLFHDPSVQSSLSKLADAAITNTDEISSPAVWRLARKNFLAPADGNLAGREPSTHLRRLATHLANLIKAQDKASRARREAQSGHEGAAAGVDKPTPHDPSFSGPATVTRPGDAAATIAAWLKEVEDRRAEMGIAPWGDEAKSWAVCCGLFVAFVYEVKDTLDGGHLKAVWRARGVAEMFAFSGNGDEW